MQRHGYEAGDLEDEPEREIPKGTREAQSAAGRNDVGTARRMSFQSREKKRRKQAAIGDVRKRHGEKMRTRHYLTITSRDCCCNECGTSLRRRRQDEAVYRHEPREILCLSCATEQGIDYRTSQSWERSKRKAAA